MSANDSLTLSPPVRRGPVEHGGDQRAFYVVLSPDAASRGTARPADAPGILEIGRGQGWLFPIADPWVAKAGHARLIGRAQGETVNWTVEDRGSKNGTFLNGTRLGSGPYPLKDGDVIRCGATLIVLDQGHPTEEHLGLIGQSAALEAIRAAVRRHADTGRPVHLTGESGTGKEVVASALHRRSGRTGALVAVNGATIVSTLAESQLFGHTEGAFTGAKARPGFFEQADGGTLFLDEVAEMPEPLQAKLLRVVETGEITRVGGVGAQKVDARIVTATLANLGDRVEEGRFREDLYWRLAHTRLSLPPLRDRRLDIMPLVDHFLGEAGVPPLVEIAAGSPYPWWHLADLFERCLWAPWPGNVRQLREEVWNIALAIRAVMDQPPDSRIPPPAECLSAALMALEPSALPESSAKAAPGLAEADVAAIRAAFEDAPERLPDLLTRLTDNNVNAFARMAAPWLDKSESTVRRDIYRRLKALEGLKGPR